MNQFVAAGGDGKYTLEKSAEGLTLYYKSYTFRIRVCTPRIFQIQCAPGKNIPEKQSLSVLQEGEPAPWSLETKRGVVVITTGEATVRIDPLTILCRFYNRSGDPVLEEKERAFSPTVLDDMPTWNVFQTFRLTADEAIYGLGQHQYGWMNHRGREVTLIQTNTVAVNPFLVSTRGWGVLWDNYSKTYFRDGRNGATFWSEYGDMADYYIVIGDSMDDVIAGYREATGKAPLLGKWAFGFWQSRERYTSAKEISDVVAEYRMRRLPLDVIVQDWRYWGGNGMWSSMEFSPEVYPNPEQTLELIRERYHCHYVISIWPVLGTGTKIYQELTEKGLTYPPVHWSGGRLFDAYSPEARDIYWNYISKGLMSKGVDGLWMDATEPELSDQHTFEESEESILKLGRTHAGSIGRFLNTYSLMATQGVYENWRKDYPGKRVLLLTRSAFAGQQRNAAVTWSGDITANFDTFRRQISAGLNFCMSGIPYWTSDIGGFFLEGHDAGSGAGGYPEGPRDPSYRELYVRWFEYSTFCPVFRSHGTHHPREVWQFGEPGSWAYDALERYLNLRYRLLPYIYSTAWMVTSRGYTMMRGLAMDFGRDKEVYDLDTEFLFGPSILVCPVTQVQYFPKDTAQFRPLNDPASATLYLPRGDSWTDFWTGELLEGGQRISRKTPIDIIPLFVRAGSIIPMGPYLHYANEKPDDPIELRIYPGADGSFTLYEDEGDTYNYEKGLYSTIEFTWIHNTGMLKIGKRKGSFPGMMQSRRFHIVLVTPGKGVGIAPAEFPDKEVFYAGEEVNLVF